VCSAAIKLKELNTMKNAITSLLDLTEYIA